jgi:hypothetical protein
MYHCISTADLHCSLYAAKLTDLRSSGLLRSVQCYCSTDVRQSIGPIFRGQEIQKEGDVVGKTDNGNLGFQKYGTALLSVSLCLYCGWQRAGRSGDRYDCHCHCASTAGGSGLDGPGIESRWGRGVPFRSDRPRGPPSLLYIGYCYFP